MSAFDVCVVGAGPAGQTIARELARGGLHVAVVEAGSDRPPRGGQPVRTVHSIGRPYKIASSRCGGVGGSSLRWCARTPLGNAFVRLQELDDSDFGSASRAAPAWPLEKDDLNPYYMRAWSMFGLARPRDRGSISQPLVLRTYTFGPARVFTDVIPQQLRADPNVILFPDCSAVEICVDRSGARVTHIRYRDRARGAAGTVTARAYVMAAGGIENARLLLASRSLRDREGHEHDHVGRYFMEHPHYLAGIIDDSSARDDRALHELTGFEEDGQWLEPRVGIDPDLRRQEGLLNGVYLVVRRPWRKPVALGRGGRVDREKTARLYRAKLARGGRARAAAAARAASSTAEVFRYVVRQRRHARVLDVAAMSEQEPNPASRIRLTRQIAEDGLPLAVLDWQLTDRDLRSMRRSQELVVRALADEVGPAVKSAFEIVDPPPIGYGFHHIGTTRMSAAAADGVVDADCRLHGIDNLYVAGSSVFPTAGCANPTLTIVALALRLADHLLPLLRTSGL